MQLFICYLIQIDKNRYLKTFHIKRILIYSITNNKYRTLIQNL